jgi:hypothetical protein
MPYFNEKNPNAPTGSYTYTQNGRVDNAVQQAQIDSLRQDEYLKQLEAEKRKKELQQIDDLMVAQGQKSFSGGFSFNNTQSTLGGDSNAPGATSGGGALFNPSPASQLQDLKAKLQMQFDFDQAGKKSSYDLEKELKELDQNQQLQMANSQNALQKQLAQMNIDAQIRQGGLDRDSQLALQNNSKVMSRDQQITQLLNSLNMF